MSFRPALGALPLTAFVAFVLVMSTSVFVAARERSSYETLRTESRAITVRAPNALPRVRQDSIDIAMELYSIDKPRSVVGPRFDGELEDRGLTTGGTLGTRKTVTIGASAFSSWGVLGSTLGHEIEVHAGQSFLAVVLRDRLAEVQLSARRRLGGYMPALTPSARESFDNDGTWRAEREAYLYELASVKRFGLSGAETRSIRYVMNYFYPEPGRAQSEQSAHSQADETSGTLKESREASNVNPGLKHGAL